MHKPYGLSSEAAYAARSAWRLVELIDPTTHAEASRNALTAATMIAEVANRLAADAAQASLFAETNDG